MLPALDRDTILEMNHVERERYFMEYARYRPDAPRLKYAIRIGSRALYSEDTYDLRMRFEGMIRKMRRARE